MAAQQLLLTSVSASEQRLITNIDRLDGRPIDVSDHCRWASTPGTWYRCTPRTTPWRHHYILIADPVGDFAGKAIEDRYIPFTAYTVQRAQCIWSTPPQRNWKWNLHWLDEIKEYEAAEANQLLSALLA